MSNPPKYIIELMERKGEYKCAFVFDQLQSGYYKICEKVGQACNNGTKLMK